ncbi:hypothetical protein PFISCL1PPCAC_23489 [Pristionchus fissidentatus]|uniref:Uncharacterized protein n=1 Tax=Pristionchus fissidentatus TaxID=1538716 RepID=A0AAV5WMD6_9BILA|nr:hypothetical protein PFISCL1PPCAC_23489 [Pristionchus fissidentatus]
MLDNEEFFFGENFRSFRLHVVKTAWIFVVIDFILILLLSGILNLTVGKFDAFSILLSLLFISVLGSAVYGIIVRRYIFLWPLLLCKAAEGAITIIILVIAFLLLAFDRSFLIHVIATRISTIEGENVSHSKETFHITFAFIYLFCQLFYCLLIFYVFFTAMDYFRKRTMFAYRQRLTPTYDFITRIHSVRHNPKNSPDRLALNEIVPLDVISEESHSPSPLLYERRASPPLPPPLPSMTTSFTAPSTAISHSVNLSPHRRFSCQRDPSSDSSAGGMLSSAIHAMSERQHSVPLSRGDWSLATPASRMRARTLTDDVYSLPLHYNTRRGSTETGSSPFERRDSSGRSQSVFAHPMSVSLHSQRAQSHDEHKHFSTFRET